MKSIFRLLNKNLRLTFEYNAFWFQIKLLNMANYVISLISFGWSQPIYIITWWGLKAQVHVKARSLVSFWLFPVSVYLLKWKKHYFFIFISLFRELKVSKTFFLINNEEFLREHMWSAISKSCYWHEKFLSHLFVNKEQKWTV